MSELRRTYQPVEKVVVGPVGGPRVPENKAKTLRKWRIRPPNRRHDRARGRFSTRCYLLGTRVNRTKIAGTHASDLRTHTAVIIQH
jgi:hypothetical protein